MYRDRFKTIKQESKATGLSINRLKAIRILEAIAKHYGDKDMFDTWNANGTEPDGTWYEYEDLVTDLLDKEIKEDTGSLYIDEDILELEDK